MHLSEAVDMRSRSGRLALTFAFGTVAALLAGCTGGAVPSANAVRAAGAAADLRITRLSTPDAVTLSAPTGGTTRTPSAPVAGGPATSSPPVAAKPKAKGPQCFAYIEPGHATTVAAINKAAAALAPSPCIGNSWIFGWSQLEPSLGTYNWSLIDAALAASKPKPVFLRVIAGTQSPAWFPRADEIHVPNEGEGTSGWMPVPWNAIFLADWGKFIKAYGARYNGNSQISTIEGAGDGPEGEGDLTGGYAAWQKVGYTVPVYVSTIATLIKDFKTAFPSKRISFAGITGPSGAPPDRGALSSGFRNDIYSAHVTLQFNGLSSLSPWSGYAANIVNTQSDGFGYQMLRAVGGSGVGPLPADLQLAVKLGASFVEVYYEDVINQANFATIKKMQA
jgi:hypothetical protein